MIMASSFFVIIACVLTAILVTVDYGNEANFSFIAPLVILGFAYSVYAGALWSSVPYVVKPNTLGTAFGMCTAI